MPPEREEDGFDGKKAPTLRPPLYNAEDYAAALKQLFSSSHNTNFRNQSSGSVVLEHSTNGPLTGAGLVEMPSSQSQSSHNQNQRTQPEMGMKKFLNGSELLFKLEADLRHAYPSFVQEFVSGQFEGVASLLEALKTIQSALDEVSGLREQRKMLMDEQKCLQCIKLALRNIEAVSKLASYPGGLYPLAAAMVSTVTATRIIALEVLTCVCSEGGADGHYKVCEALSTLRLRVGEPIRCKLIVGAISSAPPGPFQAKGIKFLTTFIASAPSPKHKVHIQCELEEAGFNAAVLRKGAELGGARESREVHVELDDWERVIIDVDTLTRQNCQLRNSVATLQQELATLKDKLKRMDTPQKPDDARRRGSRAKRLDEAVITTPVDSEEEAEQIHQILEDLNNIVNSEMRVQQKSGKKEQEIVPVHLVKSPPKKKLSTSTPALPRPWPGSSASDDDDSDIVDMLEKSGEEMRKPNVLKVVQQLENMENKAAPKHFREKHQKLQNLPISMSKSISPINEPKPDYSLPNFHKANHMVTKFANFKSSKLYSSSPDNSGDSRSSSKNNVSSGYAEVYEKSTNGSSSSASKYNVSPRFSPNLPSGGSKQRTSSNDGLRRSESLHASLASIEPGPSKDKKSKRSNGKGHPAPTPSVDKWKSMESLENSRDENFTLRWRYPHPQQHSPGKKSHEGSGSTPSPKSGSKTAKLAAKNMMGQGHKQGKSSEMGGELYADYRQNRFTKNGKSSNSPSNGSGSNGSSPLNIFARYTKKAPEKEKASSGKNHNHPPASFNMHHHSQGHQMPGPSSHHHNDFNQKDKENMKMFSLPPIMMPHAMDNHRLTDLPSGLY